jgi:lipopolysaccharide/colanic/teichoic acid biosynthesis glycosyltransferase
MEDPLAETEIIDPEVVAGAARRARRTLAGSPPFVAATAPALGRVDAGLKRAVDIVFASAALVVFAPLMALLALLVKLDSRGPALFPQTRVGMGGRTFRMLKLRTMRDGAEHERDAVAELNQHDDPRLFKIPSDPRVTRLGRIIRRWSLDELPQLYNVLAGDMSLVGPRPFFESDLADYEAHHFRRLAVKPGLTGLWQVSGRSDIVDFEEVVRLDRYYIEHWSLGLDLRILARTVPTVVSRRGAY